MLASSVAASLILASNSVTFFNKKGASGDMPYNFSETAMTERRGFPSSQRKILYNS